MIVLTRLNGVKIAVNPFSILFCEETPDTIVQFNTSQKIVVKDKIDVIEEKFASFLAKSIKKGLTDGVTKEQIFELTKEE